MSELSVGQLKGLTVNSNKINVPSGHTLYAPGHIVQVVTGTYNVETAVSSSTWTPINLSATITPKYSTSKILIMVSSVIQMDTSGQVGFFSVFRGTTSGTNLGNGDYGLSQTYTGPTNNIRMPMHISVVDSPTTASSVTYTCAARRQAGIVYVHTGSVLATITLMEIAQ